jgi:hypothetical protein
MIVVPTNLRVAQQARPRRDAGAQLVAAVLLAALLPGCADSSTGALAYSVQNKFFYMDCTQLSAQHKTYQTQIDKYESLERRAAREGGGGIIGNMAYGSPLAQARAERRLIEATQGDKKCEPDAPATAATKPAAKPDRSADRKAQSPR